MTKPQTTMYLINHPQRRRRSTLIALLLACLLLATGCAKTANISNTATSATNTSNTSSSNASNSNNSNAAGGDLKSQANTQGLATSPDKGNFTVLYQNPQNETYIRMNEGYKRERLLEDIVDELNAAVSIPENVSVTFEECGQVNAFWDSQKRRIVMCFEFIEDTANKFRQIMDDEKEFKDAVGGAVTFAFIHEVGHCLIDVLNLPATGREEDSVDQLATYVLIDTGDEGEKMALNGAHMWALWYEEKGGRSQTASEINWADEHSLDLQRFYNIICWVFGHNPDKWEHLVNQPLPENRAARCPGEYGKMSKAWNHLLTPYMKRGTKNTEALPSAEHKSDGAEH